MPTSTQAAVRLFANAVYVVPAGALAGPPDPRYAPTFVDEFNALLDPEVWTQYRDRPNFFVDLAAGELVLRTERTTVGDGWEEGGIYTHRFSQRFGYFEARLRTGDESGLNNAFWMSTPRPINLPDPSANRWDRTELDIAESHYRLQPDGSYRSRYRRSVKDWDVGPPGPISNGGGSELFPLNAAEEFVTYSVEWTFDNELRFSYNDVLRQTIPVGIFDSYRSTIPLEVIFSTKVLTDGDFAGVLGPNLEGTEMRVDWVRVYDFPGFTGEQNNNWGARLNWGDGQYVDSAGRAAVFNRDVPAGNRDIVVASTLGTEGKQAREISFDNAEVPALTFSPRSDTPDAALILGAIDPPAVPGEDPIDHGIVAGISINNDVVNSQTFNIPIVSRNRLALNNWGPVGTDLVLNESVSADPAGSLLLFLGPGEIRETGEPVDVGRTILRGPVSGFGEVRLFSFPDVVMSGGFSGSGPIEVTRGSLALGGDILTGGNPVNVSDFSTLALRGGTVVDAPAVNVAGGSSLVLDASYPGNIEIRGGVYLDGNTDVRFDVGGPAAVTLVVEDIDVSGADLSFDGVPSEGVSYVIVRYSGIRVGEFEAQAEFESHALLYDDIEGEIRLEALCPGDFNRDFAVTIDDVTSFLLAQLFGNERTDLNGDGALDFFDLLDFLSAVDADCS